MASETVDLELEDLKIELVSGGAFISGKFFRGQKGCQVSFEKQFFADNGDGSYTWILTYKPIELDYSCFKTGWA